MTGAIDVSLLPAPEAIRDLSYAAIKAERLTSLAARFAAAGLPFDADAIEGDAAVVLQEEDAWRELLDKGSINDTVKAVLAPYAKGTNLDAVVARTNVMRRAGELDPALLARYLDAFSRPAAGSPPSLRTRAREAWPQAHDIAVYKTVLAGQPTVNVVLLAANGAAVPAEALAAVQAAMTDEEAAPTTMAISVRAGTVVPWTYAAELEIPRGPDPAIVKALAETALRAAAAARYRLGGTVPANSASAALYVPNVGKVTPTVDFAGIAGAPDAAPWLAGVTLTSRLPQ